MTNSKAADPPIRGALNNWLPSVTTTLFLSRLDFKASKLPQAYIHRTTTAQKRAVQAPTHAHRDRRRPPHKRMSTCQLRMSQSYHISARISAKPNKPSSPGSGLGERGIAVSHSPTLSERPAMAQHVAVAGDPGPELKPTVVVTGGGISGLRAAAVLQRHGIEVVVLEARDRIGGRICTSRKPGSATLDIGTWSSIQLLSADTEPQRPA
jgi:hypothetical protein